MLEIMMKFSFYTPLHRKERTLHRPVFYAETLFFLLNFSCMFVKGQWQQQPQYTNPNDQQNSTLYGTYNANKDTSIPRDQSHPTDLRAGLPFNGTCLTPPCHGDSVSRTTAEKDWDFSRQREKERFYNEQRNRDPALNERNRDIPSGPVDGRPGQDRFNPSQYDPQRGQYPGQQFPGQNDPQRDRYPPGVDPSRERFPGVPGSPQDRYPGAPGSPQDRFPGSPQDRFPGSPPDRFPGTSQDRFPGATQDRFPGATQDRYPGSLDVQRGRNPDSSRERYGQTDVLRGSLDTQSQRDRYGQQGTRDRSNQFDNPTLSSGAGQNYPAGSVVNPQDRQSQDAFERERQRQLHDDIERQRQSGVVSPPPDFRHPDNPFVTPPREGVRGHYYNSTVTNPPYNGTYDPNARYQGVGAGLPQDGPVDFKNRYPYSIPQPPPGFNRDLYDTRTGYDWTNRGPPPWSSWDEASLDPRDRDQNEWDEATRRKIRPGIGKHPQWDSRYPSPYDVTSAAPGVLGFWREDIQGKRRDGFERLPRDISVNTGLGTIQGFYVYLYDGPGIPLGERPDTTPSGIDHIQKNVSVFLGIPYARPPIREGRFRPPRPPRAPPQLIQAVDFGPACPQPAQYVGLMKGVRRVDEDCLYLNIYTPTVSSGIPLLYPVMVYIHGGNFEHGSSNLFPGHILSAFQNVVVVTFNYRLGALGFLSTGDEFSPGNYGLMDQAMAIQWVYDNIQYFNGDKRKITLFGPDAGAASAGILALMPRTMGMIRQVIAQSGSPLSDQAAILDKFRAHNTSRVFADRLGCPFERTHLLVDCLRDGRSFHEIGNVNFRGDMGVYPWSPVVTKYMQMPQGGMNPRDQEWSANDWLILEESPEILLQQQLNPDFRYMSGVTVDEAAGIVYHNRTLYPTFEITDHFFDEQVRDFVRRYNYTLNPEGIYNAIRYLYTYWPDPKDSDRRREEFVKFMSDFLYVGPNDKMVKILLQKHVPVYMYVLNTSIEAFKLPFWRRVPHDSEYYFLSGAPFMDPEFFSDVLRVDRKLWTDGDRNMSQLFMETYANFAWDGEPTRQQVLDIHWKPARIGEIWYLNVNHTFNSTMLWNYRQQESAFWSEYLPTVVGMLYPIYRPVTEYWWEPQEPLQIAFWSVSGICLLLLVVSISCCILWKNAQRRIDRYYDTMPDHMMSPDSQMTIRSNIDYHGPDDDGRESIYSSRDVGFVTSNGTGKDKYPMPKARMGVINSKSKESIPQTSVV